MGAYFEKQYKNLKYVKASDSSTGLRNAQIGAIHAISSYFTIPRSKSAIVVMPTGSGKTAVLMMSPYVVESKKVLVVTPSIMVRGQIFEDFTSLRTLCKANVFNNSVKKPNVFELKNMYCEEHYESVLNADVVVATPKCALSLSIIEGIRELFDIVLIDEAHHVPAKTWEQILININEAKHILFTATPFRLDKKEIKGEMIYSYPLSMAYSDGIFGEIEYIPINEAPNKDYLIAKKAERVFYADRQLGYDHYLMIRTNSKDNAKELEKLYASETTLTLKRIDSSMSSRSITKYIDELRNKSLDGIICVDMLGEGFDFPNLKIAAIHSPHKSLASTLQFIGRFARTNGDNIGTAKFIAMNDNELLIENEALFTNDAIWQEIIIDLSENRTREEEQTKEYFKTFRKADNKPSDGIAEISLHSVRPNCHAKIFKVTEFDINASFPDVCKVTEEVLINETDNTVVGIGKENTIPKWMTNDSIVDVNNILYIVHYQKECGLLFIYSQNKTEVIYDSIAKSFSKTYTKIPKHQMNRVLGELDGFEIFNSGMQNRYVESGESYRISAGSDVSSAIDSVTGQLYSPGHVFCKASTEESEITIGYSSGSKMWSSSYMSIPQFVKWCNFNGKKIVNGDIKVKTNTNFDFLPMPTPLQKYPENIFICDYSADTYSSAPVLKEEIEGIFKSILTDISPSIIKIVPNAITIEFRHAGKVEHIECDINGNYSSKNTQLRLIDGRSVMTLVDYLNEYPLVFKTTDDILIQGIEQFKGNPEAIVYTSDNIIGIDWDKYGTDRSVEVNDPVHHPTEISIQTTVEKLLKNDLSNKFIINDHSSSEMADFITIQETEFAFEVTLYHVKKMSATTYNNSVNDVYEVAGQAVKSTIWLKTKPGFIKKVADRRRREHCKFVHGDYDTFKMTMKQNKQLVGKIVIVQPSICPNEPIPDKIQRILAASHYYIKNSGKVKKLFIWGSQ